METLYGFAPVIRNLQGFGNLEGFALTFTTPPFSLISFTFPFFALLLINRVQNSKILGIGNWDLRKNFCAQKF
ncbi:MAG: hypothetical protein DRR19_07080 [Candidatus Parabeggiatoa sp. nov. 1]|nr:MAG: hypothetical protein DRR19_07080 [Gammaproteobacteria bacterium]